MKNTFLNRVSAERKVLKAVNALFSGNQQLAGLSQAALFRWEFAVGHGRVSDVLPLLTALAEQCQRLSDRSNETFMPFEKDQANRKSEQLDVLTQEKSKSR